jgi:hypothetical protein
MPVRFLAGVFLWLLLTASGRVGNADASVMLNLSRSLLHGSVALPDDCQQCATGVDGIRTSPYGLAASVWWMPFVVLGGAAAKVAPSIPQPMWQEFFVSFANVPVIQLLLVYLALAWHRAGATEARVRWGLLVLVLATPLGPYAKLLFSDSLMALALFAAWYHWTAGSGSGPAALAGFWLGIALLSRRQADAIAPMLLLLAGVEAMRRGEGRRFGACLAALTPLLLVRLGYNAARFGSPWVERQRGISGPEVLTAVGWPSRLGQVLFSQWSGLVPYCAMALLLAAWALPRMWRASRTDTVAMLVLVISGVGFLTALPFGPGVCFGPRYAIYLVPFLALAWPYFELPRMPWGRALLGGVLAFSVWLMACGVVLDSVPVFLRARFTPPPLSAFKAMAGEWRHVLSSESASDLPALAAFPAWHHDAFQRPDFWWFHLWANLRRGSIAMPDPRQGNAPGPPNPSAR